MADAGIEVVVGTYNHAVIGLQFLRTEENEKQNWEFVPRFTDQGHDGCVKTVAASEKFLASGSTDETIRLYDLQKHVELGSLAQQSGSITDIAFSGNTHMLTASEDGTVCVWKCKSWECLKTLKGHRDAVTSISIHPTGRLALSVSKDKTIRTWNLLTGRSAYTTNIKQVGDVVVWSPSGDSYVVATGSKAMVYKISATSDTSVIDCSKTILTMEFLSETVLALAGEADEVIIFDIKEEKSWQKFKAHDIRVKSLKCISDPFEPEYTILFTVASDGSLKAWRFENENMSKSPILLAEIFIPGRPVCMSVKSPLKRKKSKKKGGESQKTVGTDEMGCMSDEKADSEEDIADAASHEVPQEADSATGKSKCSNEGVKKAPSSVKENKSKRMEEPERKKRKKKKRKEADDG